MRTTFQSIMNNLAKGQYAPVYLLQGAEAYYIDAIVHHIERHGVAKQEKGLNFRTYYGKEQNLQAVISHARCLPMLGSRQVIIVKEAQEMVDLQHAQGQKILIHYLKNPNRSTVLVFAYKGKTITNKSVEQAFSQHNHVLFSTPRIYERQIPAWIKAHATEKGYSISPEAIAILQRFLGMNLQLIANEIQKMTITLQKGQTIDAELVVSHVTGQRSFSPFELQRVIGLKNKEKTFHILDYLIQNEKQHPPILTVSLLTTFFFKLLQLHYLQSEHPSQQAKQVGIHPYFMKDYQEALKKHTIASIQSHLKALHRADLQIKGIIGGTKGSQILKELVAKILLAA